ncbi:MAG: hypothetical protein K1X33_09315, partial [Methanobacteriaceae archaeon]|nr:hypothetical protein [Methanobacteriaceae archaeon]
FGYCKYPISWKDLGLKKINLPVGIKIPIDSGIDVTFNREAISAFKEQRAKKISNTESTGIELKLFGNTIAEWKNNKIWITNAGWKTITTKDRLQILGARLKQKQGIWYLNDVEWDGSWIQIGNKPKLTKVKTSIYE